MNSPKRRHLVPAAVAVVLLSLGIATAIGAVSVYKNDFSSRGEFSEIKKSGGGRKCDRNWREKQKALKAAVRNGPTTCSFRVPVQGDREIPDHDVRLDGRVIKRTPKSMRGGAFLALDIRAGGGGVGYSLRVFPKKKRFELRRGPNGGDFPATGRSNAINKVNRRNQLRLVADGARVRAFVNGEEVASVQDDNPGQVSGRKIRFALGSKKSRSKPVVGTFKRVVVAVPDP